MSVETNIKFKDFMRAVEETASKLFWDYNIIEKRGSGIRIELFQNKTDKKPTKMWVVHKSKRVYSGDFKKAYSNLGLTKTEFLAIIEEL